MMATIFRQVLHSVMNLRNPLHCLILKPEVFVMSINTFNANIPCYIVEFHMV